MKTTVKRAVRSKVVKIGFVLISVFMLLPPLTHALSLKEALDEAAIYFTKTAVKIDPSKKMVIQVVNYHSQKQDTDAKKIETGLYFALERQFPNYELVLISEALAGVSDRDAVFVKGTYEKQGEKTIVRLQVLKGMSGIILAQTMVGFETKKFTRKTLVAVMDIEASDLRPNQRKAYSEIFRSTLIQMGAFNLASSADIDKLNPDAIQQATGCTRDECATIIGEQLGVDRSISSAMLKLGENNYLLSSKILDIKDGSILTAKTLEHKGGLDTIKNSLEKLAKGLVDAIAKTEKVTNPAEVVPKPVLAPTSRTAMIVVKSNPTDANIMLDGQQLKEKTDALLQNLTIGKHEITVFKGNLGATQKIILVPDKTVEINLRLEALKTIFQVQSTPSADLYIDGYHKGTTPTKVNVEVGSHEVELRTNDYQILKENVLIKPFVLNKLKRRLNSFPDVEITSNPSGASVIMDGVYKGETPLIVKSSLGEKELVFSLEGYQDIKKTVTIEPNHKNYVDAFLKELVELTIVYSPPSASVYIDSRLDNHPVDTTLSSINYTRNIVALLPVGLHNIKVSHPGAIKDIKVTVDLRKGKNQYQDITLQIDPDYLNRLKNDKYSKWEENEYSPWLMKFGWSLAGAVITAYLADTNLKMAEESKSKQDEAEVAMLAATTYSEAKKYSDSAASYNEEVLDYNKQRSGYVGFSVIFLGVSAYYYLNKPEFLEKQNAWRPYLDSGGNFRLAYQYHW
jgi:hypothetical protein